VTAYKLRHIKFKDVYKIENWEIKIYTIIKEEDFNDLHFYSHAKNQLAHWLKLTNGFNSNTNNLGFLILHAGTDGIFSIINWWVGDHMLNTHIFKTDYDAINMFQKISGNGLAPCFWELEIINFERIACTNYVLKQEPPI